MTVDRDRALAEFIVEQGLVDAQLRDLLLSQAKETGTLFIDLLVENGLITADQKAEILGGMDGDGDGSEEPVEPAQMAERVQDPEPAENEAEEPTPPPPPARGRSRTSPRLQAAAGRRGGFGWFRVLLIFVLLGEIGAVG